MGSTVSDFLAWDVEYEYAMYDYTKMGYPESYNSDGPTITMDKDRAMTNLQHASIQGVHNIRAGLLFDYDIMKNVSVGAEFDFNNVSDRFDSRYSGSSDWMATGQISVTYKFGHKAYGSDRTYPTQKK